MVEGGSDQFLSVFISVFAKFFGSNKNKTTGCKEGHKFVKKITKKDKKADEFYEKGEYQKAIDSWWESMNIDLSLLAFVRPTLLKVVKAHIALKEYDKAIEEARKHVDNEESVEGLHALGEAQLAGEKFDEALRTYQSALEIAVSDSVCWICPHMHFILLNNTSRNKTLHCCVYSAR